MPDENLNVSMEQHCRSIIQLAQVWKFPMSAEFHIGSSDLLPAANYLERVVVDTAKKAGEITKQRIGSQLHAAIDAECECDGKGRGDPDACAACRVWHAITPAVESKPAPASDPAP